MVPSESKEKIRLVVTGGGTGGHLFPGIAVAEAIMVARPGSEVLFIGTDRQVDNQVLGARPFTTATLKCQGLKGKSISAALLAMVQLPWAMLNAMRIIRSFKPDLVIGVGGYVTGPVLLAASLLGIPTCIHEQNSVPGLANKLLGRFVDRVFLSIPGSESFFASGRTILTGNPVRTEILACRDQLTGNNSGPVLVVMGGSQGAHRLNSLVTEGLCNSKDALPESFLVIHQTGRLDEKGVRERYEKAGVRAEVAAFFSDMAAVYSQADLLVSRAGATSLAEICVLGIPSILVPFPYAADNHQEHNALMVVERGGAIMYREAELESSLLASGILATISDPARMAKMGEKAQEVSFPDATDLIVKECLAMATSAGA